MTLQAYRVSPKTGKLLWVRSSESYYRNRMAVSWQAHCLYLHCDALDYESECMSWAHTVAEAISNCCNTCYCKKTQQSDDLFTRLEALLASNCMRIRFYEFNLLSILHFKWPYWLKGGATANFCWKSWSKASLKSHSWICRKELSTVTLLKWSITRLGPPMMNHCLWH